MNDTASHVPSISVAMATYNGARFLRQQLDSLAQQTVCPLELVVTDDRSKDETLSILQEFAASSPFPVKIVQNESNLGYADNFMKAASLCGGELIAFSDQDDVWKPHKLAECLQALQQPGVLLCVHSAEMWDGGEGITGRCPDYRSTRTYSPDRLYPLQSSYGFAMVFRRVLLEIADNQTRFQGAEGEPRVAHDQWLWLLGTIFGKVTLLSSPLVRYRQHGANLFGGVGSSLGGDVQSAIAVRDYKGRSHREARCAEFLASVASVNERWRLLAMQGSRYMQRCAQISALRALVYQPHSSLPKRLRAFLRMCLSGAYRNASIRSGRAGQLAPRPVFRGLLKDFAMGVMRSR